MKNDKPSETRSTLMAVVGAVVALLIGKACAEAMTSPRQHGHRSGYHAR